MSEAIKAFMNKPEMSEEEMRGIMLRLEKEREFMDDLNQMKGIISSIYESRKSVKVFEYDEKRMHEFRALAFKHIEKRFYLCCECVPNDDPQPNEPAYYYRKLRLFSMHEMNKDYPLAVFEKLNWQIDLFPYIKRDVPAEIEEKVRGVYQGLPNVILVDPLAIRVHNLLRSIIKV